MVNNISRIILISIILLLVICIIMGLSLDVRIGNQTDSLIKPNGVWGLIENNLIANSIIASGFLTFGIGTIIYFIFNGVIMGEAIDFATNINSMSYIDVFLALAPHGIFEISAMIISARIGLQVIEYIFIFFFGTANTSKVLRHFLITLFVRLFMVIVLTMIAGFVEWYITLNYFKGDYIV